MRKHCWSKCNYLVVLNIYANSIVNYKHVSIHLSASGLGVQALTSDESACPLNPNGDARKHRGFILVRASNALRPVEESVSVLPCTQECL